MQTVSDFLPDNKDVKERAHLWAPEIRYVKGKYVLHSLAQWGNHWVSTKLVMPFPILPKVRSHRKAKYLTAVK